MKIGASVRQRRHQSGDGRICRAWRSCADWRGIIGVAGARSMPASRSYRAAHPGLEIEWDRRSLYEFGEGAHRSRARRVRPGRFRSSLHRRDCARRLMVPFDDYLNAAQRAAFERDSVGKSWQSYSMDGRQWALPIDAACQVASYRPDLLAALWRRCRAPMTRCCDLGRRLRKDGKWLGLPLVPDRRHVPAADAWRSRRRTRDEFFAARRGSSRRSVSCASSRRSRIRSRRNGIRSAATTTWSPMTMSSTCPSPSAM